MAIDYIPALRFKALTRFYDPLLQLTTRERRFKHALIQQTQVPDGGTVIDIGCGTETLAIGLKQRYPTARVIGIDADPDVLGRAQLKAATANVDVEFVEGSATELPLANGAAQRVVSSLFFHHLQPPQKNRVLTESLRVLSEDGELNIADWGTPSNLLMRALFFPVRLLDGFANTRDHVAGRLPAMVEQSGAQHVVVKDHFNTVFGTLILLQARK
jgi:ubiquinone/menaquinone biosynthesis C-methylase UbiE